MRYNMLVAPADGRIKVVIAVLSWHWNSQWERQLPNFGIPNE
jgi:hypothetical protein